MCTNCQDIKQHNAEHSHIKSWWLAVKFQGKKSEFKECSDLKYKLQWESQLEDSLGIGIEFSELCGRQHLLDIIFHRSIDLPVKLQYQLLLAAKIDINLKRFEKCEMDSPNKREGEQQNSLFYEDDSHSNKQQISWLQRLFLGSHAVAGRRCRSIQDPLDQNQQKMLCKLTCYRCRSKHSSECSEIEGGKYRPIRRRKASL